MGIGVVMLAHGKLRRTRQVARALARSGIRVSIHVDRATPVAEFDDLVRHTKRIKNIILSDRVACDWGRFSLVEAGMTAARALLERWPDVSHVIQISGSCLPIRPLDELAGFLAARPGEDFVECAPAAGGNWVSSGLSDERFSLYFPFSWKRQRWLFDQFVNLQRRFGIKRRIPEGLVPHVGSQWWCLSVETLRAILDDPRKSEFDRFFKHCWIPDEGYVPTLVQRHSKKLNRVSLTLNRFDEQGKPHIFYDDHALLLEQTDHFFARKIYPEANELYKRFLRHKRAPLNLAISSDLGMDLVFRDARSRRCEGRKGILNAGRFPHPTCQQQPETCRDYSAFIGFAHVYEGFDRWLEATTGALAHGRIFQKTRVTFALGLEGVAPGGLPSNPAVRDMNPEQFLTNLIRNQVDRHQGLMYEISDGTRMLNFLERDENANLYVLRGSWLLDLYQRRPNDRARLLQQARRLSEAEAVFLTSLEGHVRDGITLLSLRDLLHDGPRLLRFIQDSVRPNIDLRPSMTLGLRNIDGLRKFVSSLAADGIDVSSLGRLPEALPGEAARFRQERLRASA